VIRPAGEEPQRMDQLTAIFVRERDGEGGTVWARWKDADLLTAHVCLA
jgi:hypothetical protein